MNFYHWLQRLRTLLAAPILATVLAALLLPLGAQADTKVRTSSFEYDTSGLLSKEIVEPDVPNNCLQTTHSYDTWGNKQSVSTGTCTGASGTVTWSATTARTASTTYSAQTVSIGAQSFSIPAGAFPTQSTNALGQSESKVFDPRFGAVIQLTGPNSLTTTWAYDGFGRKTRETRADATYTTWAYKLCTDAGASCPGPIGGAASVWVVVEQSYSTTGAVSAPEKRVFYDALNRPVRSQTQGFDGVTTAPVLVQDTQYNALGQVWKKSNTYASGGTAYWTIYTYDLLGRVTKEESPDTAAGAMAVTTMAYNGLVTSVTNAKGQTKTTTKNAQGQVAQVTDAQGNVISYTYNALGQLIQTNAAGSVTTLTYNQRGQKITMQDPAMGAWQYAYNAFGELVWQRDSLSQTSTIAYDMLGRMTQRTEADLVSNWYYDKKADTTACGKGTGKLCEATASNGYRRTHTYDTLGRISSTATVLDNPSVPATVSVGYDPATGRVLSKTWPTGYQAIYQYSPLGYLKKVTGGGTGGFIQVVSVEIQAMNAQGQITQYKQGNLVTTVKTYDAASGRLGSVVATLAGQSPGDVMAHMYSYDALGNLLIRVDNTGLAVPADNSPRIENFTYDSLNRLDSYSLQGGAAGGNARLVGVLYDARGNITYKSDVGQYWYDAARPNRMTNITLSAPSGTGYPLTGSRVLTYAFDDTMASAQSVGGTTLGNGNLWYTVSQDTVNGRHNVRWESYTSFNMPSQLKFGSLLDINNPTNTVADRTLTFVYGPEHQRIKQQVQLSGNGTSAYSAGSTWYLNGEDSLGLSFEKEVKTSGMTENKHYVSAAGMVFALFVSRTGTLGTQSVSTTRYFHPDHLGSVAALSNEMGTVMERLAYDPWGKRRFMNGNTDTLDAIVGVGTDRGYTMHEHLEEMGAVHMNGRIYDPLIGRFMSADPFIQSPDNLQSYNRYAYVLNNPLAYTDPSGYFSLKKLFGALLCPFCVKEWQRPIASFAIAYFTGQWVGATTGLPILGGAAGGFAQGVVSTGTLKGGLQGAFSGTLFGWAGLQGQLPDSPERYFAHAVAGCVSSAAGGGNCGSGSTSAVFGKYATNNIDFHNEVADGVAATVAGGVGSSVIAGGKFENGATTAAFGYLFNELLSRGGTKEQAGYEVRKSGLTYGEAVDQWANGGGMDVRVPLSSLDLSSVRTANFSGVGDQRVFNLFGKVGTRLSDQLVYGNVTLRLVAPGLVEAGLGYDRYNFDMKPLTGSTLPRNVATGIGSITNSVASTIRNPGAGSGTPFFIQLDGRAGIR